MVSSGFYVRWGHPAALCEWLQVAQRLQTGLIPTSNGPLRIGGNSIWGEYFKGRIDEIRIYNRALTSSQIQTDMNTPVSPAGGATLARHIQLTIRQHEALRGNASAGREKAVGLSQVDSAARQNLTQRAASASSEIQPHLIEAGEVQLTLQWQRVEFSEAFDDPVVIANAVSTSGGAPALISVRHVDPTGFEIRLQQPIDGSEDLSAPSRGFWRWNGGRILFRMALSWKQEALWRRCLGLHLQYPSAVPLIASLWC